MNQGSPTMSLDESGDALQAEAIEKAAEDTEFVPDSPRKKLLSSIRSLPDFKPRPITLDALRKQRAAEKPVDQETSVDPLALQVQQLQQQMAAMVNSQQQLLTVLAGSRAPERLSGSLLSSPPTSPPATPSIPSVPSSAPVRPAVQPAAVSSAPPLRLVPPGPELEPNQDKLVSLIKDLQAYMKRKSPWKLFRSSVAFIGPPRGPNGFYKMDRWPPDLTAEIERIQAVLLADQSFLQTVTSLALSIEPGGLIVEKLFLFAATISGWVSVAAVASRATAGGLAAINGDQVPASGQ